MAIAYKETRFDPNATVKPAHDKKYSTATGMLGVTETAIKDLKRHKSPYADINKNTPDGNIAAGSAYLALCFRYAHGDIVKALSQYGDGIDYAHSVIRAADALKKSDDPIATLQKYLGK